MNNQEKYFFMINGEPVEIKRSNKLRFKMSLKERFNLWLEVRRMRKARKGKLTVRF